jgi:Zn-dependent peptidase ImmA (M78 family)
VPNINNNILIWARESSGFSIEDAAKKLQLHDTKTSSATNKLLAFEKGKPPTRALLVKMSNQYKKPLLTFYMKNPPEKADRGEDFRTLSGETSLRENAIVDTLIGDVKARQSVLREALLEEDEAEELVFIGSINSKEKIASVVEKIKFTLNFDLREFRKYKVADDAFKYLRSATEAIGVYTLLTGNLGSHHSNVGVSTFRGFVLADKIAPFVVINDLDNRSAWSFTLLHELVHLWLGKTGVSSLYFESQIEKFCNDVASEILLPSNDLKNLLVDTSSFNNLNQEISKFSQARNISSSLVSYRLFKDGIIDKNLWQELSSFYKEQWLEFKAKQKKQRAKNKGGPNYFVVHRNKLGNALVSIAERMTYSGALTTTRAALLLGVKPLKVQKLFDTSKVA